MGTLVSRSKICNTESSPESKGIVTSQCGMVLHWIRQTRPRLAPQNPGEWSEAMEFRNDIGSTRCRGDSLYIIICSQEIKTFLQWAHSGAHHYI